MPRGVEIRIPLKDVFTAAEQHAAGWSLRSIARMRYRQWGYKTDKSALEALRRALRLIDAPVRDRIEATVQASIMHGRSRRAASMPGHPDHEEFVAHRRELRAKTAGTCAGVRTSSPRIGTPCRNRVNGTRYCHVHQEQGA